MNWNHVVHIIWDSVGRIDNAVVNFGSNHEIIDVLRGSEFSMEAWGLRDYNDGIDIPLVYDWSSDFSDTPFGLGMARLFLSFDYRPTENLRNPFAMGYMIQGLMKNGGIAIVVNPGQWADELGLFLHSRDDIVNNMKSYFIFKDEDVRAFQLTESN